MLQKQLEDIASILMNINVAQLRKSRRDGNLLPNTIGQANEQKCQENSRNNKIRSQVKSVMALKDKKSTIKTHSNALISPRAQCECGKAQNIRKQKMKIKDIKYEMQLLSKEVLNMQQQIFLLLSNFNYILQLTAENIVREMKGKFKKIFQEKNQIIKVQSQKMHALEQAKIQLQNKAKQYEESIEEGSKKLIQKLKMLSEENQYLKDQNSRALKFQSEKMRNSRRQNSQNCGVTSDSSQKNMHIIHESPQLSSPTSPKSNAKSKIKKRNTMVERVDTFRQEEEKELEFGDRIKSLGNLRLKIHRLKQELARGQC